MHVSIDIGGTNTRIGFSNDLEGFTHVEKFSTPRNLQDLSGRINSVLKGMDTGAGFDNIAVGVAGFIKRNEQQVFFSPHIPFLNKKTVRDIVVFDCPNAYLENDAALAGIAEARRGQGMGYSRVAYITISTGVGGTLVIDGKIPETNFNFEPGHHIVDIDNLTSWEDHCSGTAFQQIYGVAPQDYDEPEIWNKYGEQLAVGLFNMSLFWRPDVIVLGGSMSKKSHLFLKSMDSKLDNTLRCHKPDIKISKLEDQNGLIGGLELIKQRLS